jgi:hypothetical protein
MQEPDRLQRQRSPQRSTRLNQVVGRTIRKPVVRSMKSARVGSRCSIVMAAHRTPTRRPRRTSTPPLHRVRSRRPRREVESEPPGPVVCLIGVMRGRPRPAPGGGMILSVACRCSGAGRLSGAGKSAGTVITTTDAGPYPGSR